MSKIASSGLQTPMMTISLKSVSLIRRISPCRCSGVVYSGRLMSSLYSSGAKPGWPPPTMAAYYVFLSINSIDVYMATRTVRTYHLSSPSDFDGNFSSTALNRASASSSVGSRGIGISLVAILSFSCSCSEWLCCLMHPIFCHCATSEHVSFHSTALGRSEWGRVFRTRRRQRGKCNPTLSETTQSPRHIFSVLSLRIDTRVIVYMFLDYAWIVSNMTA
jgi:hypothetical protein